MSAPQTYKNMTDTLNGYASVIVATLENSGLDSKTQDALTTALTAAQDAVTQAAQVGALVSLIVTTPAGSREEKLTRANAAYTRANNDAQAALTALDALSTRLDKQIAAGYRTVGKPAGTDPDMLLARRVDVQDYLLAQQAGNAATMSSSAPGGIKSPAVQSSALAKAAADYLREVLTNGDENGQLDAYILTSMLDLWYRAQGADAAQVQAQFAQTLSEIQPGGTPPGVAVRALIAGGPNTLKGLIAMARVIVDSELQRAKADLARAPYTVQDNPWAKYNGPDSGAVPAGTPQGSVSWPGGGAQQQARAQTAADTQARRARILKANMPD